MNIEYKKRDWILTIAGIIPFVYVGAILFGIVILAWMLDYSEKQDAIWNKAENNPKLQCLTLLNDKNENLFEHYINGYDVCGSINDPFHNKIPYYDFRDSSGNIIRHINENVNQETGIWR